MLRNYLKIAWRHMRRNRSYALLNMGGLAVGLAACLLIGRYVADEWRHDRFHTHADRIVRVSSQVTPDDGERLHIAAAPAPLKRTLEAEVPQVEAAVRLIGESYLLERGPLTMQNDKLFYTDPSFFDVFSFELLEGNPVTALQAPNAIVLTESLAARYFGEGDPIGQTLTADGSETLTVTGVVADPPSTSHFTFDALVSMATRRAANTQSFYNWAEITFSTYVLLAPGTTPKPFEQQLDGIVDRHAAERFDTYSATLDFQITPLLDVYLYGEGMDAIGTSGQPAVLHIFLAVALFILLIAGINFINLATARSVERAREVGVRKALGARRRDLIGQFLAESVLTALLAMILALGIAQAGLPLFRALAGTALADGLIPNANVATGLLAVTVSVGLLAGIYPAFVLAGFRPTRVLRGAFGTSSEGQLLRRGLVVGQFAIAIALVASTAVVQQQLRYVQNHDLGFAAEQLVAIDFNHDDQVNRQVETIKRELVQLPGVEAAATSMNVPGRGVDVTPLAVESPNGEVQRTGAHRYSVDFDFFATYGLNLIAGRTFATAFGSDSMKAVVINDAAATHFGYNDPEGAVGRSLSLDVGENAPRYTVVGVVENFHYGSLRERVEPLIMLPHGSPNASSPRFVTLRIETKHLPETMNALRKRWATLVPHRPLEAHFVDDKFTQIYDADRRFGRLFAVFSVLAVFVACLGLFGLAAFMAERRTKEIGVRKVLGASATSIVALLSKDFVRLVVIAFVIAAPVAYYAMSRWLEDFAYRVELGPWVFVGAGVLALTVAMTTVSYQALKVALMNPVDTLRYE